MSQTATLWSLRRASRLIKWQMNYQPEGWEDPKEAGREAIKEVLEKRMRQRVRSYIEEELSRGIQDRCNGSYSRHLLTSIGDIVLRVLRSRHYNPVTVAQAYARRTQEVDRCILACFVLGLSTRKVAGGAVTDSGRAGQRFDGQSDCQGVGQCGCGLTSAPIEERVPGPAV